MTHPTPTVPSWEIERQRLAAAHAYNPADEHDACGVGLIAAIDGKASRRVVEMGISALKVLWHRGAVDADGKTGDGAGIHVEIPQGFFQAQAANHGQSLEEGERIAIGMIFLPRTDHEAQERCRAVVETEVLRRGHSIYGWRQVPVDHTVIGDKANTTRPEIEQIMIGNPKGLETEAMERDLYIVRRRIESAVTANGISDFYICSLSSRSIVYKGMFLAEQLDEFYPDLKDERFVSRFAIYHQRYSTNTFPTWKLAQPFRMLAHNGEINTLGGNVNWMRAHEDLIAHPDFGKNIEDLKPIIPIGASDSAALDAVVELLCRAGRAAPMVKSMLVPEAWSNNTRLSAQMRALYAYISCVIEPWDGPAGLAIYDGTWVLGGMDRNGLRPMRYTVTQDDLLILGSETGMVPVDESQVVEKGRVGPGEMIAVNLDDGTLHRDRDLKAMLAEAQPWETWTKAIVPLDDIVRGHEPGGETPFTRATLLQRQTALGLTLEDMESILQPMIEDGKEAVGSMGDDTPMAVLSDRYRGLHHFFRQNFSQVTNPPIDSLRERRVMSLRTRLGNVNNILEETAEQCKTLMLGSPILFTHELKAFEVYAHGKVCRVDCTFTPDATPGALSRRLQGIRKEVEAAVGSGYSHIILTDRATSADRVPVPMILATSAAHTRLVAVKTRTRVSLMVESAEALDTHYMAVLIGVGATAVCPYLTEAAIIDRHQRGLFEPKSLTQCLAAYRKGIDEGLLKIMSKMGIAILSSYRGGCKFEAVGLSRALCARYFPGIPSRISGIGLSGIEAKAVAQHAIAYDDVVTALPVGGFYKYRRSGERHAWEGQAIHALQSAVTRDSYKDYQAYVKMVTSGPPMALRDLLGFDSDRGSLHADQVESITQIRKRFVTPGMSLGALSPEAHGTLNVAMNRIGAKSDSGEGGEVPERYHPDSRGDNWNSAIKQVASGRFGVTAEYLNRCREIEIKVAQGAKPGEGGQLPGFKVTEMIAKLRHSTPGVMLISPPPHHDIYSIEDLAQLIYDLKQINPHARVCVKLVARAGIGTIAAGVAKAKADVILVSGHNGGTGASPQTSIKFAGVPWEMGLSEVHQVLVLNRLRHRVTLRTDGGIKTGRDVVIAAMLGAEEFGVGTASLVAMGCIMVRQCHSNTCPVGVCVQDERLRERFTGTPEKVVNLFSFMAEEVREILADLGYESLRDVIGRTDLLRQVSRGAEQLDDLDLNPLLVKADDGGLPVYCTVEGRNEVPDTLDAQIIADAQPLFTEGARMQLRYDARNTHRAIGTRTSSLITHKFGMKTLKPDHLVITLHGTAGQSLGAFAVQGLKLKVFGDANDYVGKGLSGGTIVVRPHTESPLRTEENTIIGNTVLYGATSGKLFAAGQAGERLCVRNSGATAVIEGCGSNGCEYMTGGTVVILGDVGDNFGAGMTGGMAFVYDPFGQFESRLNPESLTWQRLEVEHYEALLRSLIAEHRQETGSILAEEILHDWPITRHHFWQVVPKELLNKLEIPTKVSVSGVAAE